MEIKAIETKYRGYHFRSRLEARWAVFFDALGARWEYELEGFSFDGIAYLPDFFLPDLGIWCEIKGKLKSELRWSDLFGCNVEIYPELDIAQKFRDHNNAIAVVVGSPGNEEIYFYAFDLCDSGGGWFDVDAKYEDCEWVAARICTPHYALGLRTTTRDDRTIYSDHIYNNPLYRVGYIEEQFCSDVVISKAVNKSRAARFA